MISRIRLQTQGYYILHCIVKYIWTFIVNYIFMYIHVYRVLRNISYIGFLGTYPEDMLYIYMGSVMNTPLNDYFDFLYSKVLLEIYWYNGR